MISFVITITFVYKHLQRYLQALRSCWGAVEQARSYYVDWRMLRDVKRRQMAFDYADERLRINALRKNTILPKELQVRCNMSFQNATYGPYFFSTEQ